MAAENRPGLSLKDVNGKRGMGEHTVVTTEEVFQLRGTQKIDKYLKVWLLCKG